MPNLEFDLDGEHSRVAYKLLAGVITPRPIAWITTSNEDGSVNLAPFSFFNVFGTRPPILGFAPGDKEPGVPKDTARNIRRTGEFVVHMVREDQADLMNESSAELDYSDSEADKLGLALAPCQRVETPRLAAASVALECTEHGTLEIGQNRLVLGRIHIVHTAEGVLDPETFLVQREHYSPIGRMEVPAGYCRTTDHFVLERPD